MLDPLQLVLDLGLLLPLTGFSDVHAARSDATLGRHPTVGVRAGLACAVHRVVHGGAHIGGAITARKLKVGFFGHLLAQLGPAPGVMAGRGIEGA